MKPFIHTFRPCELSLEEFDGYLAEGYFPSGRSLHALSHLVRFSMGNLTIHRAYRVRYHVDDILLHPSHQKIRKRNQFFNVRISTLEDILPNYEILYQKYLAHISFETAPTLIDHVEAIPSVFKIMAISVYDGDQLIAVDLLYAGAQSFASILCFYDPAYAKYSLGKYTMLLTVNYMRENGYVYYYLGYILQGDPQFDYKLYLGEESTKVYDVENKIWTEFDPAILEAIGYTEEEKAAIIYEMYN